MRTNQKHKRMEGSKGRVSTQRKIKKIIKTMDIIDKGRSTPTILTTVQAARYGTTYVIFLIYDGQHSKMVKNHAKCHNTVTRLG